MGHLSLAVLVVGVLIAAYADVRTRRIPNLLTGALAAVALTVHATGGLTAFAGAALVMLVAFAVGTVAFSLGWFGGGDVKLLAACCGFAGYPGTLSLVLFTLVAGGLVSVLEASRRGKLRTVLAGTFLISAGITPSGQVKVPYAIAIAIGTCTYVYSVTVFNFLRLPL